MWQASDWEKKQHKFPAINQFCKISSNFTSQVISLLNKHHLNLSSLTCQQWGLVDIGIIVRVLNQICSVYSPSLLLLWSINLLEQKLGNQAVKFSKGSSKPQSPPRQTGSTAPNHPWDKTAIERTASKFPRYVKREKKKWI